MRGSGRRGGTLYRCHLLVSAIVLARSQIAHKMEARCPVGAPGRARRRPRAPWALCRA